MVNPDEMDHDAVATSSRADSYVMVLVDAHSHTFANAVLQRSPDQSYPAFDPDNAYNLRKCLQLAIRRHLVKLPTSSLGTSRVVVRVLASLTKLENDLLCPLQQFSVLFSSADPFFDFVNVCGETIVEQKITELFTASVDDPKCKHIFLAAWRRPMYLSMLRTPSKKVTLVKGSSMGPGAKLVSLPCTSVEIPTVFSSSVGSDLVSQLMTRVNGKSNIAVLLDDKAPCRGGLCGFTHVDASAEIGMRCPSPREVKTNYRIPGLLPQLRDAKLNHVPVNKAGQRLDYYLRRPSASDRQAFAQRISSHSASRPCRWFHLAKACRHGDKCSYDHSDISPDTYEVLRYLVKRVPCTKGSECRRVVCVFGNVCSNPRCVQDDSDSCTLGMFHRVDPVFASWAQGWSAEDPAGDAIGSQADDAEDTPAESFWF